MGLPWPARTLAALRVPPPAPLSYEVVAWSVLIAITAVYCVVAATAVHDVITGTAQQNVIEAWRSSRAATEAIAMHGIVTRTADQLVLTVAADKNIVAGSTVQLVTAVTAIATSLDVATV